MGDMIELMKKVYLIILAFVILSGVMATVYLIDKKDTSQTVTINNKKFNVELAQTEAEREKGLMHRNSLDINSGMLFVYNTADIRTFWMKDTLIPLDIIFINNNKIVEITTLDPATPSYTPQYTSPKKSKYVLELNAGAAEQNGFKVGDKIKMN